MLVTWFINFAAIVLLRSVEAEERVKILLASLHEITRWPSQFYNTPLKVRVPFDLCKKYVLSRKNFLAHWYARPIRYSISSATSIAKSPDIGNISTCCPSFKIIFYFFFLRFRLPHFLKIACKTRAERAKSSAPKIVHELLKVEANFLKW